MGQILSGWLLILGAIGPATAAAPGEEEFEARVRPVLAERCWKCHGPEKQSSGLRLDSREAIVAGGDNGPAVVPGDPESSPLIKAVRHAGELKMPPKGKLPDAAVQDLTAWVKAGAPWPKGAVAVTPGQDRARTHWAFQPIRKPPEPPVKDRSWIATPVDAFIRAALEAKGLTPSARADKRTLIRRATFDLTGLPPTEAEIAAFEADGSPGAFANVVDRLLASPRYGERWGRHWLDVARYADTKGYVFQEERRYPYAYTYRDYVIRAFNEDLPFDQFVLQQLAADRLSGDDPRRLAALGFLTLGRRFLNVRDDIIDDRIDVVTRGLLGLTVSCARCHDHKFDPIPTEDYYSLHGVFASSMEPEDPPILPETGPNPKLEDYRKQLDQRRQKVVEFLQAKHGEIQDDLRTRADRYLRVATELEFKPDHPRLDDLARGEKLPRGRLRWFVSRWGQVLARTKEGHDPVFAPWHALAALPGGEFAPKAAEWVQRPPEPGKPVNRLIAKALADAPPGSMKDVARIYGEILTRCESFRREPPKEAPADPDRDALVRLLAADDGPFSIPAEETVRLLDRAERDAKGNLERKIAELDATHPGAPPRAMAMRDVGQPHDSPILLRGNPGRPGKIVPRRFLKVLSGPERPPFREGSGRLDLAREIVRKDNPLTARVIVNRIWMHHFGAGLVTTPSDFGHRSDPPSNPDLLDYLATRFVEGDWSLKGMHRLILLSNTYQEQSADRPECRAVDPSNRLLWKHERRRLDFEAMRDAILAVAGDLDTTIGGRPVSIVEEPFSRRRTVYGFIDRQNLEGVYRAFDFATPDATSARRFTTSVPQQALFLMNSPFVAEQARHLARQVEPTTSADPEARIRQLYGRVFGRTPEPGEIALGVRFLATEGPAPGAGWIRGYGGIDDASGRVAEFHPFPHWTGTAWQVGEKLPNAEASYLNLSAEGGHVGPTRSLAAIVRWVAPRDAIIAEEGRLGRESKEGDGVRGRVVSSRSGVLGTWVVQTGQVGTSIARVEVKQGETIDFVVDCLGDDSFDSFTWAPSVRAVDGRPGRSSWDAREEFQGPAPEALSRLEQYAQALMMTNEFMYTD